MEFVFGFIVIIVFVAVIFGDGGSTGRAGSTPRPPRPSGTSTPRHYGNPNPTPRLAHQREIERQQRADEAFFDGVVFGHYFIDSYGPDDEQDDDTSVWADDHGDDFDDEMYD